MRREDLVGMPAIVETIWFMDRFDRYKNPKAQVSRLVRDGWIIRLKPGLYVDASLQSDPSTRALAANRIYGPSYVSFATALRIHNLIPEAVPHMTSATYRKRRTKTYHTPMGSFYYRDVPSAVYPHAVDLIVDQTGGRHLMASAQKAVLDQLCTAAGIRSRQSLRDLLFSDLRIDPIELEQLSFAEASEWAAGYRSGAVDTFMRSLKDGRVIL